MGIELVMLCIRWDNDMLGHKEEDSLAFANFTDEETSCALMLRSGLGSNLQAECRSEGTVYIQVGGCVIGGDIIIELWTG